MIQAAVFIVLLSVAKFACAGMIVNGGFDANVPGGWVRTQPYACTSYSTTVFHDGTRSAQATGCDPAATFTQTVTGLTIGQEYELSYWLKGTGAGTFSSTLGGTLLESLSPTSGFGWTLRTYNWTAGATTADLVFSTQQASNASSWYLDTVDLVPVSTPGSLMLLGIGAMMFGFAIRKHV